jgi:hypothetical protein
VTLQRLSATAGALGVAAALAIPCAVPATARGFCRTTTAKVPDGYDPTMSGCITDGHPVYWKNRCAGYSLFRGASRYFTLEQIGPALERAFLTWTGVVCPGPDGSTTSSAAGRVSIDVRDLGVVDCDQSTSTPTRPTSTPSSSATTRGRTPTRRTRWPSPR